MIVYISLSITNNLLSSRSVNDIANPLNISTLTPSRNGAIAKPFLKNTKLASVLHSCQLTIDVRILTRENVYNSIKQLFTVMKCMYNNMTIYELCHY